jgi:glutaredoxin 3
MKNAIVYSTPSCMYCGLVKDFFKENNVQFTEHNVATDLSKRKEMIDKTGQMGVPVIEIDGQVVVGFDEPKLRSILQIA